MGRCQDTRLAVASADRRELVAELERGDEADVAFHLGARHRRLVEHDLQAEAVEQRAQPPRRGPRVVGVEHAVGDAVGDDARRTARTQAASSSSEIRRRVASRSASPHTSIHSTHDGSRRTEGR